MANVANYIVMQGFFVYDPATRTTAATKLVNQAAAPRTVFPNPFNIFGLADTRPREGQVWPRGDGQAYGV